MCCVVGEVVGVGGSESGGGIGGGGELLSGSGGRRWGGSGQRSIAGRAPAALLRAWRGRLELVGEAEMARVGFGWGGAGGRVALRAAMVLHLGLVEIRPRGDDQLLGSEPMLARRRRCRPQTGGRRGRQRRGCRQALSGGRRGGGRRARMPLTNAHPSVTRPHPHGPGDTLARRRRSPQHIGGRRGRQRQGCRQALSGGRQGGGRRARTPLAIAHPSVTHPHPQGPGDRRPHGREARRQHLAEEAVLRHPPVGPAHAPEAALGAEERGGGSQRVASGLASGRGLPDARRTDAPCLQAGRNSYASPQLGRQMFLA